MPLLGWERLDIHQVILAIEQLPRGFAFGQAGLLEVAAVMLLLQRFLIEHAQRTIQQSGGPRKPLEYFHESVIAALAAIGDHAKINVADAGHDVTFDTA
jgi:predicted subunit of tRNA(5-methylaminomethyl-2-thiouridylate) methyltransferase